MNTNTILTAVICLIIGLAAGFMVANKLNRSGTGIVPKASETTQSNSTTSGELDLTDDEIEAKLNEAAASPNDVQFQKRLGISLYRSGTMKRDASIIGKALVPLGRANTIAPDDKEVISTLGNAYFDIGYFKKEKESLVKSREYYEILLKARPDDVETRTDLGLTYFLTDPPEFEKASNEFRRSLEKNPNHEKTLQFYIQTLVKLNKTKEANEALAKLRAANPKNPALSDLTNFIDGQAVQ
jgi:tetratricopeptide (TPR) repeat protein